ncbi:ATP-binding cassette domain-containing protein [Candidatus Acetothermia bacterium]|nr:ATP-binding cassette domain-containing protein [Candidatus Acetothermia bacterium]MBI3643419.1 ATP-binding cassette domain-containing protein [Candidatus Acetothermia bacterium]
MSLFMLDGLFKRYGGDYVLQDVSLQLGHGDRVALIGANGSGKSTLLRILAGIEEPTRGQFTKTSSARIGYLSQEPELNEDATLFSEVMSSKSHILEMEQQMRQIEKQLAEAGDHTELLHTYDALLEAFQNANGYEAEAEVRKVLYGLEFTEQDEGKLIRYLSGGERARAALSKLLLEQPDILLLDEPTNHLDVYAVEWLEEYLASWKGAFVICSHDRFLLDRLAERVWEVEASRVNEYTGNYTKAKQQKQLNVDFQNKRFEEQQEQIKKSEEYIRRNIAGGYFREQQAKSRQKALDKLERLDAAHQEKSIHFTIQVSKNSGKDVVTLENLAVGFPPSEGKTSPTILFECPEAKIYQEERIALIGPNGSGKSSLIKTILRELPPIRGRFELGYNVEPSYFRQSQWEEMSAEMTVIDSLIEGKHQKISEARDFLGMFLFSEDDVFKKVKELSGGQRSRIALARLAQLRGNFLILDEPTNHLDISSREVLEEALSQYKGTMLFVSHDRYLIQALATQIWEIRDGKCRIYKGDYDFYLRKRSEERSTARARQEKRNSQPARKETSKPSGSAEKAPQSEQKSLLKREAEFSARLEQLEVEIARLEHEMETASYEKKHAWMRELSETYQLKKNELGHANQEWTAVVDRLQDLSVNITQSS